MERQDRDPGAEVLLDLDGQVLVPVAPLVGQADPEGTPPANLGLDEALASGSACPTLPDPPFFMEFRGPKAHPNRLLKEKGVI